MGDGSRLENGRAIDALRVRLPLLPLCALGRAAEAPVFHTGQAGSIPAGHFIGTHAGIGQWQAAWL